MQFCLTPGLLSTRAKVIKYKYVKNSNKIIEIVTRKNDKYQLEATNILVGYSFHLLVLYENYLICIFLNIYENLKMRTKPLDKLVLQGVIRPTLNP